MVIKIAWKEKLTNKGIKFIDIHVYMVPGYSETKTYLFIYKSTKTNTKHYRITALHTNYKISQNTHNRTFLRTTKTFIYGNVLQ